MQFFSNKIYLQDSPKTFGDLCKEASASREESITKTASKEVVAVSAEKESDTGDLIESTPVSGPEVSDVPDELLSALKNLKDDAGGMIEEITESSVKTDHNSTLKVSSIKPNEDGTVTVGFGKKASDSGLCDECNEEPCGCADNEVTEEACSYANSFGKFVKVSNLTSGQKGYFRDYWNSVWPKDFIEALLLDQ